MRRHELIWLCCGTFAALGLVAACSVGDGNTGSSLGNQNGGTGAGDLTGTTDGVGGFTQSNGNSSSGNNTCSAIAAEATPKLEPADIIFGIDTSGSMGPESGMVQDAMNAFSTQISQSGIDIRVIMLAEPRPPGFPCIFGMCPPGVCIEPPLGSGNCNDDTKLPEYFHVPNEEVGSWDGFKVFVESYDKWKTHLRPDATKTFVVVTDDDATLENYDNPDTFIANIDALDTTLFAEWKMNGIYCFTDCDEAASVGTNWKSVVDKTGGVHGDLCNQEFQPIFDDLADAIILGAGQLPCQWDMPDPPENETLDPKLVNVEYTDGSGGTETIYKVDGANDCSAGGWYYDNPTTPTTIFLCPATCDVVSADAAAKMDILFGCATQIK